MKDYGSAFDNEEALSTLTELRDKAYEADKKLFSILVESLSTITKVSSSTLCVFLQTLTDLARQKRAL